VGKEGEAMNTARTMEDLVNPEYKGLLRISRPTPCLAG
jgi:hypothetical protein